MSSLLGSVSSSTITGLAGQFKSIVPSDLFISLGMGFLVGIIIAFVYRKTFRGVLYSPSFALTLVMLTLITTPVVMCIKSDIALSMGMVGALSIVRFRAAIKEPLDIAFLFWSIAAGIVLAAGYIPLAVVGSALIGVMLLLFANKKSHSRPFILVVRCINQNTESSLYEALKLAVGRCTMKSKTVQPGSVEVDYEVRLKDDDTGFINYLGTMPGVLDVALVSYNGDYMS